jgi:ATP diphosphatase
MSDDPAHEIESALRRGVLVGARAAAVGFDWDTALDALEKVAEEVDEVREALSQGGAEQTEEELGDLLFAVCNVARKAGIDPEDALSNGIGKFQRRFERVRTRVEDSGQRMEQMSLEQLETIWQTVK